MHSCASLKICPCGKTPESLSIYDAGQGTKWAYVTPDCCCEWSIEFMTGYHDYGSPECIELAANAWNTATRVEADGIADLQYRIDQLMLEYCADEMTEPQLENWAAHQKRVDE